MNYSSQGVKLQVNAQAEPLQNQVARGGLHVCSLDENEQSGRCFWFERPYQNDHPA